MFVLHQEAATPLSSHEATSVTGPLWLPERTRSASAAFTCHGITRCSRRGPRSPGHGDRRLGGAEHGAVTASFGGARGIAANISPGTGGARGDVDLSQSDKYSEIAVVDDRILLYGRRPRRTTRKSQHVLFGFGRPVVAPLGRRACCQLRRPGTGGSASIAGARRGGEPADEPLVAQAPSCASPTLSPSHRGTGSVPS